MRFNGKIIGFLIVALTMNLIGCGRQSNQAQGYVEGRYTYIATNVSGILKQLSVQRGAQVKRGDALFALEEQPESDLLVAAKENLQEAVAARDAMQANLEFAKLTYERYKILVPKKAIEQSQLDNAKSKYEAAIADVAKAGATVSSVSAVLEQTKWNLEQKTKTAPVDGIVFDTYYQLGELTIANQPVLSLLAPQDISVIFYVPGTTVASLKLGGEVSVQCDSCINKINGKIRFISPTAEYTPPVIYSNETNQKMLFRVEAEFEPADARKLHPGQPVDVTYQVS